MPKFYAEIPKKYIGAVAVVHADNKVQALELINAAQRQVGESEISLDEVMPLVLNAENPVQIIGNGDY